MQAAYQLFNYPTSESQLRVNDIIKLKVAFCGCQTIAMKSVRPNVWQPPKQCYLDGKCVPIHNGCRIEQHSKLLTNAYFSIAKQNRE